MSGSLSTARHRLNQIQSIMAETQVANEVPYNPDAKSFPSRKDVPRREDAPEGAAWVWGKDDNVSQPIHKLRAG